MVVVVIVWVMVIEMVVVVVVIVLEMTIVMVMEEVLKLEAAEITLLELAIKKVVAMNSDEVVVSVEEGAVAGD